MPGSLPLCYQIELRRANLGCISCSWGMLMGIRSVLHPAKPLYSENSSSTTRSPSPTSTDSQHNDNDVEEEVWEELDTAFRTQEAIFMANEDIDEDVALDGLGFISDTLGISNIQTPTPIILPHQGQPAVPDIGSDSPSRPILSSSRPLICPLLLIWPSKPVLQSEYSPSPSCSQATLPSKRTQADGCSTADEIASDSPTGRFSACEDQIRALIDREAWVHGTVINTLGDFFCYGSRSQCRARRYEILPSWLFDCWSNSTKDQTASQNCRRNHSASFKEVASPVECRAWLVPALLNNHWYLLALDWIDCQVRIYDSLATCNKPPPSQLAGFGTALVTYANQDFDLGHQEWAIIPEQVCNLM